MRLRSPNILLVCLLAVTTLWLSETAAAHVHLDNHTVSCEILHSASGGLATLQSQSPDFLLQLVNVGIVAAPVSTHPLQSSAPRNSRAPPAYH